MTGGASEVKTGTSDVDNALSLGAALLAGMYIVARATANQFFYYSGEAAFAGLIAILLGLCVAAKGYVTPQPARIPRGLILLVIMWLSLFLWGTLRSPNPGLAVPLAADAGVYALLLLCGYMLAARGNPALLNIAARAMIAMVAVQSFAGVWQYYIDLPRLQADVRIGKETLPLQLQTARGLARFGGTDVFGTFGNPNSLAAYIVAGFWLLAGVCWNAPLTRRVAGAIFAALMLWALVLTHSKGGIVACAVGAWFFLAQRWGEAKPGLKRPLFFLTAAGVIAILAALSLSYYEKIDLGASLVERFGYWKSAFAMWADRPLEGVGLGGFAEYTAFYKIPLGKETREAHNDYLHLLCELGVLGPVLYLAIWALLLRGRNEAGASEMPADSPASARLDAVMLAGGVFAFLLMYAAFQSYNSAEIVGLLSGLKSSRTFSSVIESLGLPILFALVMRTTRPGTYSESSSALWHGVRAAIGAVLIHELIDFDFRAQAVIGGLLFLAGMGYARGASVSALQPTWRERPLLPLLSIALIPIAFWIPMTSGLARAAAENRDDEARTLSRKKSADPSNPESNAGAADQILELRREAAALRRQAVDAAPFDSAAWVDLAGAYESLQAADHSRSLQKEILDALTHAEHLRPVAAHPKILLGDFYFRDALREGESLGLRGRDFDLAYEWYAAGARRYPLSPGLRLLSGDAQLLRGKIAEAAGEYLDALDTDIAIDDLNIRLTGIFTNGYSAALPRHGHDGEVLSEITRRLAEIGTMATPDAPRVEAGLQLRRMVAFVGLIHEFKRRNALSVDRMAEFRAKLMAAADRLVVLLPSTPERAHAALLFALSFEMGGDLQGKDDAWARAAKLQEESRAGNHPGTPQELFDFYFDRFGKPRPESSKAGH